MSFSLFIHPVEAASSLYYQHPDHLGGQNVTTDESGGSSEILDYTPYGAPHLDNRAGTYSEQNKFEDQPYDPATSLSFFNQRVLNPTTGHFLSQDPQFQQPTDEQLSDPQRLNPYSFARDNPLRFIDEDGEAARDFQRNVPMHPMFFKGQPVLGSQGLPVYRFNAGESLGSYKGVPIMSNGADQGTASGPLAYQCLGFVKAFYHTVYGVDIGQVGSAGGVSNVVHLNQVTRSRGQAAFVGYGNGHTTVRPQDDDLVAWQGGAYGHVGVVANVYFNAQTNRGYVDVVEQNWGNGVSQSGISRHELVRDTSGNYHLADRGSFKVYNWIRLESHNP